MKYSKPQLYREVQQWIYRNARPLEHAVWKNAFENGSKDDVLLSLSFYQNEDGGFGNALEPDNWNPHSSPYTTLYAMNILKDIGFCDINHPLLHGILKFLNSEKFYLKNGEWLFVIPSNNDYPRAPWWTYDSDEHQINNIENIGTTAAITAFIIQYADVHSELFHKAIVISHNMISRLKSLNDYGDLGIEGYCMLADSIGAKGLTHLFEYEFLVKILKKLVYKAIERDPCHWIQCNAKPSLFIKTPESIFYKSNEEIVQAELDYLIEMKPSRDVWEIE